PQHHQETGREHPHDGGRHQRQLPQARAVDLDGHSPLSAQDDRTGSVRTAGPILSRTYAGNQRAAARAGRTMTPMSATLELRVLSGLHRDARCKARHGHLLGADPDCDIVLADEGLSSRSARLILGDTAWGLAAGDDDPGPADAADTPYNQPMPLGPVWWTVARPEDPWPTLPESSPAGIATDSSDSGDTPPAADAPATAAPESPAEHPESTTADSVRSRQTPATGDQAARSRPGRRWIALLGLTLAIMAVMVALALASQRTPPPTTPTRPDPRVAAEQSIPRIQSALDTLGLSSRLRVSLAPGGTTALVSGWVRDAAERGARSAALA